MWSLLESASASLAVEAKSHRRKRKNVLRLLATGVAALCLPAWLGRDLLPSFFDDDGVALSEEMEYDAQVRRSLLAIPDENDYPELAMPQWLIDAGDDPAKLETAMSVAMSTFVQSHGLSLTPYTLDDAVQSDIGAFKNVAALLVYDPEEHVFLMLHNRKAHNWVSGGSKLVKTIEGLAWMLMKKFPERFAGPGSDELVVAVSSGDYPHLTKTCLSTFPHANDRCAPKQAPVLQFGSAFRNSEVLPNQIAMPMPAWHHLQCFKMFTTNSHDVCQQIQDLIYVGDVSYENLVPQVVWRGTDFGYLNHFSGLTIARIQRDIMENIDPAEADKKTAGVRAIKESYDLLRPRWKGVVLTAEADREAAEAKEGDEQTLSWANIKFTRPDISFTKESYEEWNEYGVPAMGESMSLDTLAQYKYQLDLGGGGGTTWSGTIEKLAMPGLLFHHVTPTKDYIHDLMQPWVHYVPISPDLKDLKEKYEWAESHPVAAKMIADQASSFMKHLATTEGFGELYREQFIEPMRAVIDAYQPVSKTNPGMSWKDVLNEVDPHYRQAARCGGKSCQKVSLTLDNKPSSCFRSKPTCKKITEATS